ncbi:LexA family protein [Uliginosibacterium sp. sgz301328]|uniref:LexA family protein n=1 Tax=Uliginosibacterium sp. sgz301328 TaxID=3243764 RepID=UPI00359E186D
MVCASLHLPKSLLSPYQPVNKQYTYAVSIFFTIPAMKMGIWIRKAREAAGLTQTELGDAVGTSKGNVSAWELGRHSASFDRLRAIARATGYALPDSEAGLENVVPADIGARQIPLINYVQACQVAETLAAYAVGTATATEYLLPDRDLSTNAFALEIKGSSMQPEFREGDRVIIDPAVEPHPGDYVVAKNGKNEATFKKYRPRGLNDDGEAVFELVPLNEDYPSLRSDREPITIIGTMVEHRRYRAR